MNMTSIANEYLASAQAIKIRMDELKEILKSKKYNEQKTIEDRLVVLSAEYYHLLQIAGYLFSYYKKAAPVSRQEVQYNR